MISQFILVIKCYFCIVKNLQYFFIEINTSFEIRTLQFVEINFWSLIGTQLSTKKHLDSTKKSF